MPKSQHKNHVCIPDDALLALKVGSYLDTRVKLLGGVCTDTILAKVVECEDDHFYEFELTFRGVVIGKSYCERKGKKGDYEWGDL